MSTGRSEEAQPNLSSNSPALWRQGAHSQCVDTIGGLCLAWRPRFQPDFLRHAHEKTPLSNSTAGSQIALLRSQRCDQGPSMGLNSSIREGYLERSRLLQSGYSLTIWPQVYLCHKWGPFRSKPIHTPSNFMVFLNDLCFPDPGLHGSENSRPTKKTKAQTALPATQWNYLFSLYFWRYKIYLL